MGKHIGARRVLGGVTAGAFVAALCACAVGSSAAAADEGVGRGRTLLDAGWSFHLGDVTPPDQVVGAGFDDSGWTRVDLPHDYVLGGTYANSPEKTVRGHGYLPYEVGWYRKTFTIPAGARGKVLRLDFEGAFRDSRVWLNGKMLGEHKSGYTPFSYDVSKVAKVGGENTLVVRVDPREFEGWWYEGGGIYRHVWLTALSPVHVAQFGTYVTETVADGEKGASERADVTVETEVENSGEGAGDCRVVSEVVSPSGETVGKSEDGGSAPAGGVGRVVQHVTVEHPQLWSLETPRLYELRTTVVREGKAVDSTVTTFGIRTLKFDPNAGFFLNGKHVHIQGAAAHQDFAGVGIAVPDGLQAWRVGQLKKWGANGWRTAHNPPNEALLEACDRLGMLVMDENRHLGDAYTTHSKTGTPADDLSDLAVMIKRDRNHPSVIMWSMCNEEGLQGKPEGVAIFKKMMEVVHQYDRTRPITSAMNNGWLTKENDGDAEDIVGVNYNTNKYDAIHARHPDKMMYASECMNEKTTRGEYADDPATGMRSAFNLSEDTWLAVGTRKWMGGEYVWTGFDYKGEPNPYGWPDVSNNTGLVDTCGFPKDKAYYFKSRWSVEPMVHIVPGAWNWAGKEGQPIRVIAWSNAKKVELSLNGKSLGVQDVPFGKHAEWQVPYAPGELSAKAMDGETVVATDQVETTGKPARVRLASEWTTVKGGEAVVVTAALVDEKGRVVPDADQRITFKVGEGARVLGVGNGNPADHDTDKADNRKTFHGLCIVVVRAGEKAGEVEVTGTSPGVEGGKVSVAVK